MMNPSRNYNRYTEFHKSAVYPKLQLKLVKQSQFVFWSALMSQLGYEQMSSTQQEYLIRKIRSLIFGVDKLLTNRRFLHPSLMLCIMQQLD